MGVKMELVMGGRLVEAGRKRPPEAEVNGPETSCSQLNRALV
jgi:hypothetical protein